MGSRADGADGERRARCARERSGGRGARAKEPAYESTVRLAIADLQDYWGSELPAAFRLGFFQGEQSCADLVPTS